MSVVVIAETLRRHLTSIAYVACLALLAIIAIAASQMGGGPGRAWASFVWLLALVAGAGVLGPEFSSGTLQLILVKPIRRATYLVSRVAGVVLAVWIAGVLAFACELAGRAAKGDVPWNALATTLVHTMADALLVVALLALLGTLTRAYYNVAIYFFVMILVSVTMGLGARKLPKPVLDALAFADRNLYPELPPRFDRDWLLMVVSNAAIAIVLACFAFRRREVPYGAD